MIDLIASYLAIGANKIFHLMPMRFNLWVGRNLGNLAYYLNGKRKRITYANLKAAFWRGKSPLEIKRLTKEVYRNAGQTLIELISMTKVDKAYLDKYIETQNREYIDQAAKNPNGMLLISAHFGNWELMCVESVMNGYPLHLVARDQKMKRLNELFNLLRESKGNFVIRKGMDIKNVFRILRNGGGVGLLGDQNAGQNGKLLELFDRPASTAVGPFRFAQSSGAWVVPAFIHRIKGPYQKIILEKPMIIGKKEDIVPYMEEYHRLLEKHVREHPEQWFWMHKKWKLTPVKKILVLDDGKKGHLKQSLAVVKQLKRYRKNEGFSPDQTQVDIVEIRFKNKFAKAVFNLLNPLFTFDCQGEARRLSWFLERKSYEEAVGRYADVVISCGSTLSGVNLFLKIENNARNLAVLDPGAWSRRKFDLVVIPRHDCLARKIKGENVIMTDLAPNSIEPDEIASWGTRSGQEQEAKEGARIGVLLGGDNQYFSFGEGLMRSVVSGIKGAGERVDGFFYVTTSRRTPDAAEAVIKETFGGYPRCLKFVSGKDDPDKHTVEKILAFSDVVVVSGESISMVSEAVSSGKPVLVFMPDKKKSRLTKYERFVRGLEKKKYLKVVDPERIPEAAENYINGKIEHVLPEDDKRILEKMYKLF